MKGGLARHSALITRLFALSLGAFPSIAASDTAQHRFLIAQKNRREILGGCEPLTFEAFLALPGLPTEYTDTDWPTAKAQISRAVSLEGCIAEVFQAFDGVTYGVAPEDGDFHVHLRPELPPHCYGGKACGKQLVVEVTPHFQGPATGRTMDRLLARGDRQAKVRVSGWLLHDHQRIRDVGDWRGSTWEIHPVTPIAVKQPATVCPYPLTYP